MGESTMRIAALVMAHKNDDQVGRLIDRLAHPDVDVFLHLDAKWDLSQDRIDRLCTLNGGRVYLTRRVSVEPMTYLSLTAELVLIEEAMGRDYGYLMLLSGQDYPLKPVDSIVEELAGEHPRPFVDVTMWHERNWVATSFGSTWALKSLRATVKRGINNRVGPRVLNKALRGGNHVVAEAASRVRHRVSGPPAERLRALGVEPAGGSQWWILPADMAATVLERSRDDRLAAVFKNVGSPDETFVQSVLANSRHASRLTVNPWDEVRQMTRTYTHFEPGAGHPVLLGVADFDTLAESDALFARKFDLAHDEKVLDLIDERLLSVTRR